MVGDLWEAGAEQGIFSGVTEIILSVQKICTKKGCTN